jgi:Uma2 family endonuclease
MIDPSKFSSKGTTMATADRAKTGHEVRTGQKGRAAGPRHWRWNAEQFRQLDDLGFFEDRRIELVNGKLIELTTNPPHDTAVTLTCATLRRAFGAGLVVREERTLDLGRRYQPRPDASVVWGSERDYANAHPIAAVLVVEVSESSLRYDRVIKGHRYAQAEIPDYWIVNLVDRQLEVYRNPGPDPDRPGRFRYADVTIVPADGQVAPLAEPDQRIEIAALLP